MQDVAFGSDFDRMACVASALIPDHDIGIPAKEIHDFPFTLVTPLGPYQQCVRHENVLSLLGKSKADR
jgi:hypothetical protein